MRLYKSSGTQPETLLSQPYAAVSEPPRPNRFDHIRGGRGQAETRLGLVLGILAGLLLAAYCFYGMLLPQTPSRLARPSAALISERPLWAWVVSLPLPIPHHPFPLATCLIGVTVGAFAVYGLAIYISWQRPSDALSLGIVVSAGLLFCLVAVWSLPNVNTDIFNYIVNGRVAAVYHHNPYSVPAAAFPHDPLYRYASPEQTRFLADAKLPLWTGMSVLLARLAGDDAITNLLVYRGTLLLFNLANLALIALLLRKLMPHYLLTGMIVYAWHPIVAVLGQSKTDTVMVFFLLLALLCLVTTHRRLALMALGCSVLVKLLTLPLVAVYWLAEIRRRQWRELGMSMLLLSLTGVVTYAAFWEGSSLLLSHIALTRESGSAIPAVIRPLVQAGFVLVILGVGLTQRGSHVQLLRGWAVVMLYFSLFLTKLAFAWYLLTLIALVSLAPDWRLVLMTVVVSFSSFLFDIWDTVSSPAFPLPDVFIPPRFFIYTALPCFTAIGLTVCIVWRKARQQQALAA